MRRRPSNDGAFNDIRSDVPFILLIIFDIMLAVALLWMNPKATPVDPQHNALRVQLEWDFDIANKGDNDIALQRQALLDWTHASLRPGHSRADLDLWVCKLSAPTECVGYNTPNRQTTLFKMDQDDLGWNGRDPKDDRNVEVVTGRRSALPAGTYAVNVHLFSAKGEGFPIKAYVDLVLNEGQPGETRLQQEIDLTADHEEQNVFVFELDKDGKLVPGSLKKGLNSVRIATGNLQFLH